MARAYILRKFSKIHVFLKEITKKSQENFSVALKKYSGVKFYSAVWMLYDF